MIHALVNEVFAEPVCSRCPTLPDSDLKIECARLMRARAHRWCATLQKWWSSESVDICMHWPPLPAEARFMTCEDARTTIDSLATTSAPNLAMLSILRESGLAMQIAGGCAGNAGTGIKTKARQQIVDMLTTLYTRNRRLYDDRRRICCSCFLDMSTCNGRFSRRCIRP